MTALRFIFSAFALCAVVATPNFSEAVKPPAEPILVVEVPSIQKLRERLGQVVSVFDAGAAAMVSAVIKETHPFENMSVLDESRSSFAFALEKGQEVEGAFIFPAKDLAKAMEAVFPRSKGQFKEKGGIREYRPPQQADAEASMALFVAGAESPLGPWVIVSPMRDAVTQVVARLKTNAPASSTGFDLRMETALGAHMKRNKKRFDGWVRTLIKESKDGAREGLQSVPDPELKKHERRVEPVMRIVSADFYAAALQIERLELLVVLDAEAPIFTVRATANEGSPARTIFAATQPLARELVPHLTAGGIAFTVTRYGSLAELLVERMVAWVKSAELKKDELKELRELLTQSLGLMRGENGTVFAMTDGTMLTTSMTRLPEAKDPEALFKQMEAINRVSATAFGSSTAAPPSAPAPRVQDGVTVKSFATALDLGDEGMPVDLAKILGSPMMVEFAVSGRDVVQCGGPGATKEMNTLLASLSGKAPRSGLSKDELFVSASARAPKDANTLYALDLSRAIAAIAKVAPMGLPIPRDIPFGPIAGWSRKSSDRAIEMAIAYPLKPTVRIFEAVKGALSAPPPNGEH